MISLKWRKKKEFLEKKGREEFDKEFEEKLEMVGRYTPVSFENGVKPHASMCGREMIPAGFINKKTGEKEEVGKMKIIESHEKGHTIRKWKSDFLRKKIMEGFDLTAIKTEDLGFFFYFSDPMEPVERMSQLKNYFGMKGNEKFTKEHLFYAREFYIKDTEFDNNMTQFFQAITPEKEDAFIELINSVGI